MEEPIQRNTSWALRNHENTVKTPHAEELEHAMYGTNLPTRSFYRHVSLVQDVPTCIHAYRPCLVSISFSSGSGWCFVGLVAVHTRNVDHVRRTRLSGLGILFQGDVVIHDLCEQQ